MRLYFPKHHRICYTCLPYLPYYFVSLEAPRHIFKTVLAPPPFGKKVFCSFSLSPPYNHATIFLIFLKLKPPSASRGHEQII